MDKSFRESCAHLRELLLFMKNMPHTSRRIWIHRLPILYLINDEILRPRDERRSHIPRHEERRRGKSHGEMSIGIDKIVVVEDMTTVDVLANQVRRHLTNLCHWRI